MKGTETMTEHTPGPLMKETKMTFWIITYHHRHGVDVWPVWQDKAPDLDLIANTLEDWEPNREEWLDHAGPFSPSV